MKPALAVSRGNNCRAHGVGRLWIIVFSVSLYRREACAQYAFGTSLFNQSYAAAIVALETALEMAPRPAGTAPAEAPPAPYTEVPSSSASTFTQNVIFDPCRGHAAGCCNNTFGTPEFVVVLSSASVTAAAVAAATGCNAAAGGPCDGTVILRADGSPKAYAQARSVERDLVIDADCSGAGSPFAACESPLLARQQSP